MDVGSVSSRNIHAFRGKVRAFRRYVSLPATFLGLVLLVGVGFGGCISPSDQTPPAAGVTTQQFTQRMADVDKRLKALEDAASQTAGKMPADVKKEIDDLKLRVSLLETRPLPSGLTADERARLDSLDKRLKALEPTPTPTPTNTTPIPTPTPTPVASASSVADLSKRVDTLEKQVQQLSQRTTTVTTTPTPTPTPTATPFVDLRVVNPSVTVSADSKTATVTGEVLNKGTAVANPVSVIFTFYKLDGSVLGYAKGTPAIASLPAGETTPFSFTATADFTTYGNHFLVSATIAS